MLENIRVETERSELVEKANSLKPQFKNKKEAIDFYSQALETICSKNGKTIQEFLMMAEGQVEYDSDLSEALSLARTIKSLRSA